MEYDEICFLMSERGKNLLREGANYKDILKRVEFLKKNTSEYVASLSNQITLREKARKKFRLADTMLFIQESLEQASADFISEYIGKRFKGYGPICDLTCGIGGDSIGLAKYESVIVSDISYEKTILCRHNLKQYGYDVYAVASDANHFIIPACSYFIDPSRRVNNKRVTRLEDSQPSLETIQRILKQNSELAIKASPAIDYTTLPFSCEIEVISVGTECREIMIWCGAFNTAKRRATKLPQALSFSGEDSSFYDISNIKDYIYEVDSAILRAYLLQNLAEKLQLFFIDHKLGYLTGDYLIEDPWIKGYRVDKILPFSLKKVKKELRKMGIGKGMVKSRGFVGTPQEWQKKLFSQGKNEAILFLFRIDEKPFCIISRTD